MRGADLRCSHCNQYAPDRCLCGRSITNPAVAENMRLARQVFENDMRSEFGGHVLIGSPMYSVRAIDHKWFTFWQCWQTATHQHMQTIAALREKIANYEAGAHLRPVHLVASTVFENAWHEVSEERFSKLKDKHVTRIVFERPACSIETPAAGATQQS